MNAPLDAAVSRGRVRRVYLLALFLTLALFFFHTALLFDVASWLRPAELLLTGSWGIQEPGRVIILGCFIVLLIAHVVEGVAWGLFLRWRRLTPTFGDGLYFASVTMTTLGYGDLVLPRPWRHLAPMIAISGVLMFGCSTAFLFLVMQAVWTRHL